MNLEDICEGKTFHPEVLDRVIPEMTADPKLSAMSEIFQCFSDPTRLKIINALLLAELCVCDLTQVLGMSQPSVSHHLKQLRQMRLVKCRRAGKNAYYTLDDAHIQQLFDLCKAHVQESYPSASPDGAERKE